MAADIEHDTETERQERARREKLAADADFEAQQRAWWAWLNKLRQDHGDAFVRDLLRDLPGSHTVN